MTPEQKARVSIDALLQQAGWHVCDMAHANIHVARGVALREFPLNTGYGFADYLLYIDGKAAGVIEAKKEGSTLTGVEIQSARYAQGLPSSLPAWRRPLPFSYESTGIETHFTQGLDPQPRARAVFAFHRPETLAAFLKDAQTARPDLIAVRPEPVEGPASTSSARTEVGSARTAEEARPAYGASQTFLARLQNMPPLIEDGLWPAQIIANRNLEASLKANKPRALVQMATGSGKTFTAISFIYRLIKFAGARRVLFLVDRGNLGRQAKKEFDQYTSPYNNFKFGEEYIVQHLTSNQLDTTARVTICTIQRLFSMLKGRELASEDDEQSVDGLGNLFAKPEPIGYNPSFPIETFDIIVTDEAHRSIYNLWRQVLEYFDAYLIGLTATPSKQTFGFFNQNLVMEYGHQQAVADGVNVNYDVYRIRTQVSEQGSQVEAGYSVGYRDRLTRKTRWQELDEDMAYDADALDRAVQTPDQIRTIVRTFRDKLHTEIFPGRTEVPKTIVFAKDDNHAEKIVEILREEFGKGNDFAQKITYRTTGEKPENLISAFRNSYFPRIAVTVDMIATGTDIKPVEIVMFMRSVKSRNFFEQMKGRGVRIIPPTDLQAVTPDAKAKDHFVIVDCVGVCEQDKTDSAPMDQKKSVPFDKLLQAVALGNVEPEVLSSVAARLARLDRDITEADKLRIVQASGGYSLKDLARGIVDALDPDNWQADSTGAVRPELVEGLLQAATKPLCDPALRNLLIDLKKKAEQIIDTVTQDSLLQADFSEAARERAQGTVDSFERFIAEHKDEITALQILYNRPQRSPEPLTFEALKTLADALQAPPHLWTEGQLWQAYAALDKSKVKGENRKRILTDLVSLVRFAMHQDNELVPFPERVNANFKAWLAQSRQAQQSDDPAGLPLNSDLVCMIGGRGTGKSCLVDYVGQAFGPSPRKQTYVLNQEFAVTFNKDIQSMTNHHAKEGAELPFVYISQNEVKSKVTTGTVGDEIKQMLGVQGLSFDSDVAAKIRDMQNAVVKLKDWFGQTDEKGTVIYDRQTIEGQIARFTSLLESITTDQNKEKLERFTANISQISGADDRIRKLGSLKDELDIFKASFDAKASAIDPTIPKLDISMQADAIERVTVSAASQITNGNTQNIQIRADFAQVYSGDLSGLLQNAGAYRAAIEKLRVDLGLIAGKQQELNGAIAKRATISALIDSELKRQKDAIDQRWLAVQQGQPDWTTEQRDLMKRILADRQITLVGSIIFDSTVFFAQLKDVLNLRSFRATSEFTIDDRVRQVFQITDADSFLTFMRDELHAIETEDFVSGDLAGLFYDVTKRSKFLRVEPVISYGGRPLERLSVGQKGTVYLCLKLATQAFTQPLIFDQPEDDLDNEFIIEELVDIFRGIKQFRQVILVSHNANLVVNADADQVIVAKNDAGVLRYTSGSLEDPATNQAVRRILEGGDAAFLKRELRYNLK